MNYNTKTSMILLCALLPVASYATDDWDVKAGSNIAFGTPDPNDQCSVSTATPTEVSGNCDAGPINSGSVTIPFSYNVLKKTLNCGVLISDPVFEDMGASIIEDEAGCNIFEATTLSDANSDYKFEVTVR